MHGWDLVGGPGEVVVPMLLEVVGVCLQDLGKSPKHLGNRVGASIHKHVFKGRR